MAKLYNILTFFRLNGKARPKPRSDDCKAQHPHYIQLLDRTHFDE